MAELADPSLWPWNGTRRRLAWLLLVMWGPFVVFAAILTISIYGALFGIPLLLLTVPPFAVGWRHARDRPVRSWWVIVGFVAVAVFVALVVWGIATGVVDDGFDTSHVLLAILAAAWAWLAGGSLFRSLPYGS